MILELLSRLYENQELFFTEKEWKDALDQAIRFDLAPQLYYLIQQQNRIDSIPSFVMNALKLRAIFTSIQNGWIRTETEQVIAELSILGIPVIALKGTRFAETYFGHYGARRTGDIDLLVPRDRFEEAETHLRAMGYALTDNYFALHYHVEYSKIMPNSGGVVSVELHRSLLRGHRSQLDVGRIWEEAIPVEHGAMGFQLTLQQTMYEMCLHSSKHFMTQYRHVLDVAHLIYRYGDQIDYDELLAHAREDGTFGMVTGAMSTVYRLFPGLHGIKPLPRSSRRIPWYSERVILNAELKNKGLLYYFHQFMYPLVTSDGFRSIFLYLKYSLIPPRDQMENEMGIRSSFPFYKLVAILYRRRFENGLRSQKNRFRNRQGMIMDEFTKETSK